MMWRWCCALSATSAIGQRRSPRWLLLAAPYIERVALSFSFVVLVVAAAAAAETLSFPFSVWKAKITKATRKMFFSLWNQS